MGNSFLAYLEKMELMAFFSGYALLYALIILLTGDNKTKNNLKQRMVSVLPYAYALTGTLYLGLQLKNSFFKYSSGNLKPIFFQSYLVIWGLLSLLFWIPALARKKELSLLHSLVFFFFLAWDLISHLAGSVTDRDLLPNDMRIYTISFLLNSVVFIFVLLLSFLFSALHKETK